MAGASDDPLAPVLAGQEITGLLVDERYGGAGLGLLEATVAAQELGRAATPYSFHSAAVAVPLLLRGDEPGAETARRLGDTASGEALLTAVLDAPQAAAGGRLRATARLVPDAGRAAALLVVSGDTLLLVPADAEGVHVETLRAVDETREVADVTFSGLAVDEHALGPVSRDAVERARRATLVALAADAFGAASRALEMAAAYARERRQFGRVIGSFQAVKHLLAETAAELDPVQSLLWYTAHAWDRDLEETAWLAPLLKAHAVEVATRAVTNTTQVYGGMGFTHECDMHVFFKRVAYDRQMLGGPSVLLREAAQLRFATDGGG
jgi:alkylation response protein AidB-like acyl-CoA dehydrogenase